MTSGRWQPYRLYTFAAGLIALILSVDSPWAGAATPAASPVPAPQPKLVLPRLEFEAGKVTAGTRLMVNFPIRNAGKAPLTIEAHSGCGCMVASCDREIAPGGTGMVRVGVATIRLRGEQAKHVRLVTNDPAHPEAILTVHGTFLEPEDSETDPTAPAATSRPAEGQEVPSRRRVRQFPGPPTMAVGRRLPTGLALPPRPLQAAPAAPAAPGANVGSPATPEAGRPAPKIELPTPRKDLGEVPAGEQIEVEFPLSNTGTGTLLIEETVGSCHCITASCPKTLKPGESGVLKVRMDTYPLASGPINKQVTIVSNDPVRPRVRVELVAQTHPLFQFSPSNPRAVHYKKGEEIRELFTITAADPSVSIDRLEASTAGVEVRMLPQESSDPAGTWRVEVTAHPPASGGDFSASVLLHTTHPKVPTVPITLWGITEGMVVASPSVLYLGDLGKDTGTGPPRIVILAKRSGTFKVLSVQADSPALQAELQPLEPAGGPGPGSFAQINVRYLGGWEPGPKSGKIHVTTDDPTSPQIEIPYNAVVETSAPASQ